ncbi:GDP-L-galactose phosphorylase 2 isoform X2 [Elaeis guineensis]|uniref:GDP-L-galactose phosphorylase 2 isoform X2 n=1 Tax=Elaeis guineensis var. tenera TaxID=51953 RepID=A0A6J0PFC6_ELAGV|nr:GDP-L-galactose phosphorylase 2 isoform X2 [Elaeis guineensis]
MCRLLFSGNGRTDRRLPNANKTMDRDCGRGQIGRAVPRELGTKHQEFPTVMSGNQEGQDGNNGERGGEEFVRDCLSKCRLLRGLLLIYLVYLVTLKMCRKIQWIGGELPLYCFSKAAQEYTSPSDKKEPQSLFLDRLLKEWEDRRLRGLFHHDITACETKILPGEYGFMVVLVEGRDLKKRPTEFGLDKVLQPFDGRKFNFTKIGQEEVLFRFEESENDVVQYVQHAPVMPSASPNVSPIAYGHVLLIPHVLDCMPQRIDRESFLLAMHMAREAKNSYFRVGYNSLGAFATINHLHFQAYYLTEPFPVEKAPFQRIATLGSGVKISQLLHYPVRGLVLEGGSSLQDLSTVVSSACIFLQDNNCPYNALISDSGKKIFLLPQWYAEKKAKGEVSQEILEKQVNPAIWELSGHFALKRRQDYEEASEGNLYSFLEMVSLSEERFEEMKGDILEFLASGSC